MHLDRKPVNGRSKAKGDWKPNAIVQIPDLNKKEKKDASVQKNYIADLDDFLIEDEKEIKEQVAAYERIQANNNLNKVAQKNYVMND